MNVNQKEQLTKLKGERTIQKRQQDSPTNPNLANLAKVHRKKVPPKRKYVHSPKKGGAKKTHRELSPSSPEKEDEDNTITAHEVPAEANKKDADYEPQETVDIHEITQAKSHNTVAGAQRSHRNTDRRRLYPLTMTQMMLEQAHRSKVPTELKFSSRVQVRRMIPRKDKKTIPERNPRYQVKHKSPSRQIRRHL